MRAGAGAGAGGLRRLEPSATSSAGASASGSKPRFVARDLPLNANELYDVSVADADQDGDYDMFTTHHRFRGNLLANEGGNFVARLDASKLSSTADLPGFDDQFGEPSIVPAGLYIWVDEEGRTHIVTHDLDQLPQLLLARMSGSIRFRGRDFKVEKAIGARLGRQVDTSTHPPSSVLTFNAGPNAEIVVRAQFMDLPFDVSINELFPRQRVFMGPRRSIPPSYNFDIDLGDRHGTAWADFNQDGIVDAYIANGGNRGAISRLSEQAGDELYFGNGDGSFHEDIEGARISKGFCRGRSPEPVDFDGDGDLDIFVGCENGHPLLYNQKNAVGRFGSSSNLMQEAKVKGDLFRWIDLGHDGIPELISVFKGKVQVYRYNPAGGQFLRTQKLRPPGLGKTLSAISIGDVDNDLDPDVFISAPGGNALLIDRAGGLYPKKPTKLGLPGRGAVNFSFLDYDNDGRIDAHATPGGLYQGLKGGGFERTGELVLGKKAQWAASSWFDFEGDGDRDLVSLIKRHKGVVVSRHMYENRTEGGHWLELSLQGPRGNQQAIGAKAVVTTKFGRQAGWVGQSEGSRHSSGLYDLYFGLGLPLRAKSVEVFWPNGTKTKLQDVAADQRLTITPGS